MSFVVSETIGPIDVNTIRQHNSTRITSSQHFKTTVTRWSRFY